MFLHDNGDEYSHRFRKKHVFNLMYIIINIKNVPKIIGLKLVSTSTDTYLHTSYALQSRIAQNDGEQKESYG
jgi:hypothetical protein